MSSQIRFTSELSSSYLDTLQQLLFFNENQSRYREAIIESIERFGEPQVRENGGVLRIHTSKLGEVQALFALAQLEPELELVGVAVFARVPEDTLALLHVGVNADYASNGPRANDALAVKLFQQVMDVGRRIRGIRRAVVLYHGSGSTVLRIRP